MSKSKKDISQSSLFSFFCPIDKSNAFKDNNILQKSYEKRTHKEIAENSEKFNNIEKNITPLKKSFPPKSKNEEGSDIIVKDIENNINSLLSDFQDKKKPKKKIN